MVTMQLERYETQTENKTYFRCYNPRLRKFLGKDGGLRWKKKGFNEETNSYYWTFEITDELSRLLNQYKKENSFAR